MYHRSTALYINSYSCKREVTDNFFNYAKFSPKKHVITADKYMWEIFVSHFTVFIDGINKNKTSACFAWLILFQYCVELLQWYFIVFLKLN